MAECPCGAGLTITPEEPTCPACGTDLTPLYRIQALGEQISAEREHFLEEKQKQEKRVSLMKKALFILPVVTLLIGFYVSSMSGPAQVFEAVPSPAPVQVPASPVVPAADGMAGVGVEKVDFVYTVKKGDTLSKLARVFYGDSNLWVKIYEANSATLTDPDIISTGAEIAIPYDR